MRSEARSRSSKSRKRKAEAFGGRIRTAREKAQLSADELAFRLNLHRSTIYRIEAGDIELSVLDLERFAAAIGCNLSTLIEDETEARAS